jgi:hypothetical protein
MKETGAYGFRFDAVKHISVSPDTAGDTTCAECEVDTSSNNSLATLLGTSVKPRGLKRKRSASASSGKVCLLSDPGTICNVPLTV